MSRAHRTTWAEGVPKRGTGVGPARGPEAHGSQIANGSARCRRSPSGDLILPGRPPAPCSWGCGVWSPILSRPLTCVCASVAQAAQWVQKTRLSHVIGEKKQVSEAGTGKDKQNSKAGCKRYYSKARSHKGSNSQ